MVVDVYVNVNIGFFSLNQQTTTDEQADTDNAK